MITPPTSVAIAGRREQRPDEIGARILHLPGYGVYAWDAEERTSTLTRWVRPTAVDPSYR